MPNLYRSNYELQEKRKEGKEEKKISHPKKKKTSFKTYKKNTLKSLNEVEYFLRNFNSFIKYVKLYKILK